jgi:hypothetical protein
VDGFASKEGGADQTERNVCTNNKVARAHNQFNFFAQVVYRSFLQAEQGNCWKYIGIATIYERSDNGMWATVGTARHDFSLSQGSEYGDGDITYFLQFPML